MTTVPNVKMLINGKFVESGTSHFEDVLNPATQEVLARVPFSTQAEISDAIPAAQQPTDLKTKSTSAKSVSTFPFPCPCPFSASPVRGVPN